jgi:hypothetical protein
VKRDDDVSLLPREFEAYALDAPSLHYMRIESAAIARHHRRLLSWAISIRTPF